MKPIFNLALPKVSIWLIVSTFYLINISCKKSSGVVETGTGDLAGMIIENIPGTSIQYARQIDANGRLLIEGFVEGSKKTGQWIEYTPEGDIRQINHYVNGMLHGASLHMGFRNQVDQRINYKANQPEGEMITYKFGKVIEKKTYVAGKLEGTAYTYDDRTFKLRQEVQYKNGLQDGYYKYYDDEGNLSLEYLYKNGEKISGGIVEKQ